MPEKTTQKTGRLGTQMRGALASAYDARGHLASDLFYAYSPRMDQDVVLSGALQFGHFLLVESDPNIVRVDYAPAARITLLAGEATASLVNAEVIDNSGALIWHEVKASRALERSNAVRTGLQLVIQQKKSVGWPSEHRVFTELDIYANPLRIRNWNRVISWMAQARHFPLLEERRQVFEVIRKKRSIVLAEVLSLVTEERRGLAAAALFKAVQEGRVQSDLDIAPLSLRSVFFLSEENR